METLTKTLTCSNPQWENEIKRRVGAFCDVLKEILLKPQMLNAVASFFENKPPVSILDLGTLLSQKGLTHIDVRAALLNEDLFLSDSDTESSNLLHTTDNHTEMPDSKVLRGSAFDFKSTQQEATIPLISSSNGQTTKQKKHKRLITRKPVPIQTQLGKEAAPKKKRTRKRKPVLMSQEEMKVGEESDGAPLKTVVQENDKMLSALVPHPIKVLDGTKTRFQCPTCPSTNSRRDNYVTHYKEKHISKTKFKCPECPASFQYSRDLKRHNCSKQLNGDYCCCFCQKQFISSKTLKEHEKRRCKLRNGIEKKSDEEQHKS